MRARIAIKHKDYDRAYDLLKSSLRTLIELQPTKASTMSIKYRLGCVRTRQQEAIGYGGDLTLEDEALEYLHGALSICQMNEPHRGDKGESARVKHQLSIIMERRGMSVEAKAYREDAENIRDTLIQTGKYGLGETPEDQFDALIQVVWR